MPLNPRIARILEMVALARRPPYHTLHASAARAAYAQSAPILDVAPAPMFDVRNLDIPARDAARIPVRLYYPRDPREPDGGKPAAALLYLHGGGFTVGSIDTHDSLCRVFARDAGCVVASVGYRLAPEHRFPTALNDAFDALCWLHREAEAFSVDPARLAIGGDSAGGTLATVCAVLARDAAIPLALQLLIYPGTSARQQSASHARYAEGHFLTAKTIQWFFAQYLRADADRDDWRFAPLDGQNAPDFAGVAPAWIAAADHDPLFDENIAYAAKLEKAGVPVTLKRYEGMIHEFFKMGGYVPEVLDAHADAVRALKMAFEERK